MKNTLLIIGLFFTVLSNAQETIDNEMFLDSVLDNYTKANSLEIKVTVKLYERDKASEMNTFQCTSKFKGNKTYVEIRNTELFTADSLRLFIDHNNRYAELQKTSVFYTEQNPATEVMDAMQANKKAFINTSKIENTDEYLIFTREDELEKSIISYYFNKETMLLDKVINSYKDNASPYRTIEMIYATNINEINGSTDIRVKDYLTIDNGSVELNEPYTNYEFVNHFNDE